MTDRCPCINPRCGRTFERKPGEPDDMERVCGKCWRLLPVSLTRRYKALRVRSRRLSTQMRRRIKARSLPPYRVYALERSMEAAFRANWKEIHDFFYPVEKPEGLDTFLEELGL